MILTPAGLAEVQPAAASSLSRTVRLSPLFDVRWPAFVDSCGSSSIFHTRGWLQALKLTYGYDAIAYAEEDPEGLLHSAIVFSRVRSRLTGNRLVSIPFADHCQPLVESRDIFARLITAARQDLRFGAGKYFELRPRGDSEEAYGLFPAESFCFHTLDLTQSIDKIWTTFHKDCIQRKIRRAERENLSYEYGTSEELIAKFYSLMLLTRRRHQLPPQPLSWFRNLAACLPDNVRIHLASKNGQAIAAILTLKHHHTVIYKYGCSNDDFNAMGGTPFLFWKVIQYAKSSGMRELDLGRSDRDNEGLIAFKDRLGATRDSITYWRSTVAANNSVARSSIKGMAKKVFAHMPDYLLTLSGRLLYRHSG